MFSPLRLVIIVCVHLNHTVFLRHMAVDSYGLVQYYNFLTSEMIGYDSFTFLLKICYNRLLLSDEDGFKL